MEFPKLTVPSWERSDFLEKLQVIADSEFREMVVLSPFVDSHIIRNIIDRCIHNDRRLLVVTRYRQSLPEQRRLMDEARELIEGIKNYTLKDRVKWEINERLHAKCVICDWREILFGSQNLTQFGGLGDKGKGNFELGVYLTDLKNEDINEMQNFVDEIVKMRDFTFYPR